jgi:hypothetical protein
VVLFGLFGELTDAHVQKTINPVDLSSLFICSVIVVVFSPPFGIMVSDSAEEMG